MTAKRLAMLISRTERAEFRWRKTRDRMREGIREYLEENTRNHGSLKKLAARMNTTLGTLSMYKSKHQKSIGAAFARRLIQIIEHGHL